MEYERLGRISKGDEGRVVSRSQPSLDGMCAYRIRYASQPLPVAAFRMTFERLLKREEMPAHVALRIAHKRNSPLVPGWSVPFLSKRVVFFMQRDIPQAARPGESF